MRAIIHIIRYELNRYIFSTRMYFLLLVGLLPMLLFLALTAEKAKLEILVGGLVAFQTTLTIGFVFFTYIVSILVCIVIFSDLIGNENAFEFLLLSTSRINLLFGKLASAYLLLLILVLESLLAFIIILITYNVPLPPLSLLLDGIIIAFLSTLIISTSISLFASTFTLRFNFHSSIASYISIFIFFVIPLIIYMSFFQIGLIQVELLNFSIHTYFQEIVVAHFISPATSLTSMDPLLVIGFISGISYILSFIFFLTTPIQG